MVATKPSLIVLGLVGTMATASQADTVNTFDHGWYKSDGSTFTANTNYTVGFSDLYRNFFAFDLPNAPSGQQVVSASFTAFTYDVSQFQTVTLREYAGSVTSLVDGTAGVAGYDDLGDGTVFGSHYFAGNEDGVFVTYTLNAAAVTAINAALGDTFAFGGRSDAGGGFVYGNSTNSPMSYTHLDLTFGPVNVPLPTPATLAGLGLLGVGLVGRRRISL